LLEAAGYRVEIPRRNLCCGRPLYDFGMLDRARTLMRQCLDALKPHLDAGACVVGIEPSCTTTFRDEAVELFPHDPTAKRLKERTMTLPEFLVEADFEPPRIGGTAIYHGHCYQKAVLGMDAERRLLPRVRRAAPATRVVIDGFSCRKQVEQLSETVPVSLPELLAEGLRSGGTARGL
jgi:Fe-S oxidoreductase